MWRKMVFIVMIISVTANEGQMFRDFLFRDSFLVLPDDRDRKIQCIGDHVLLSSSRVVYCEQTGAERRTQAVRPVQICMDMHI